MLISRNTRSFDEPAQSLGNIGADTVSRLISAASDVTLIIDKNGIVQDVAFGSDELAGAGLGALRGLPWIETVAEDSRHKVAEMLSEADLRMPTRWRQVNHASDGGEQVPIRYSLMQVTDDGRVVALGRDLRAVAVMQQQLVDAQLAVERDYARLRQAELRYRLLFQLASEAIVIADAATGKIVEANPAAHAALGETSKRLTSQAVSELFDPKDAPAVRDMLTTVRNTGGASYVHASIAGREGEFEVSASLFRQGSAAHLLVRLSRAETAPRDANAKSKDAVAKIVESFPDGFVVAGLDGHILTANTAFLEMAQLANEEQTRGKPLGNWLARSAVELNALMSNLREYGSVRAFATVVNGAFGSVEDVEVSAVGVMGGELPCFGFVVRHASGKNAAPVRVQTSPRSVEQLTGLVGRVPLKDLVRESSDMIERLCIEAALELTGDNRASAAEMLGLSRQSLYVKLRRYGLGDLTGDGGE